MIFLFTNASSTRYFLQQYFLQQYIPNLPKNASKTRGVSCPVPYKGGLDIGGGRRYMVRRQQPHTEFSLLMRALRYVTRAMFQWPVTATALILFSVGSVLAGGTNTVASAADHSKSIKI